MKKVKASALKVGDVVSIAYLDHCRRDNVDKAAPTNRLFVLEDHGEVAAVYEDRVALAFTQSVDPDTYDHRPGDEADMVGLIIKSCIVRVRLWGRVDD